MKKFLIVNPFGIGDVLFTTPVIEAIKNKYPDSFIGYWCNQRTGDLFAADRRINVIYPLSRGDIKKISKHSLLQGIKSLFRLFQDIKKSQFDIALDFSLDHRYALILKLAGIKKRLGFDYKSRGRFLTDKIGLSAYQEKHVVQYYLDLLKFINIAPVSNRLKVFVSEESKIKVDTLLSRYNIKSADKLIGIAPGGGASWGLDAHLKHWPAENFAALADKLISELNAKILLLGGQDEIPIADAVTSRMKNKPINLFGKTSLPELTAVINKIGLLIANDGGPLHIGVALDKKTVSFFGPVSPAVYGPYPPDVKKNIVFFASSECAPCYNNFRFAKCNRNQECLREILVDDVFKEAASLLSTTED